MKTTILAFIRLACLTWCLMLVGLALAGPSLAAEPDALLKERVDKVITILRSPEYAKADTSKRRDMLLAATEDFFDKEEVARRTLGVHWKAFSPDQRKEFVQLFQELLEQNYTGKLNDFTYKGEKVEYLAVKKEGDKALIQTKILSDNRDIPIDYAMLRQGEGWKIYDIAVEGVSLVKNYRNQFHDLLNKENPDAFLKRLRDKVKQGPEVNKQS